MLWSEEGTETHIAPDRASLRPYLIAHLATLAVGLLVLLHANRRGWFFYDEWDFITQRGLHHPDHGLFVPHNEHWSTLPILAYRLLLTTFGLHSYWPFVGLLLVVHLGLCHLLWRVMLAVPVHPLVATGLAGVFTMLGAGAQNLLWAFQIGFVGSLFFGWAFALVAAGDAWSRRRLAATWALGLAALMCSGVGVTMIFVGALVALLRIGWRRAALVASVPLVVFAAWYVHWGRNVHEAHSLRLTRIPGYVATGVSTAALNVVGVTGRSRALGLLLALVVVALVLARTRLDLRRYAWAVAPIAGVLVSWLITAAGRAGFGTSQATASRYVYDTLAIALPAIALAADTLCRPDVLWQGDTAREEPARGPLLGLRPPAVAAAIVATGLLLWANINRLDQYAVRQRHVDALTRNQVLAAAYVLRSGQPYLAMAEPTPKVVPGLQNRQLLAVLRSGWLPDSSRPDADSLGYVQIRMQVGLNLPGATAAPVRLDTLRVTGAGVATSDGCLRLTPNGAGNPRLLIGRLVAPALLTFAVNQAGAVHLLVGPLGNRPAMREDLPVSAHRRHRLVLVVTGRSITVDLPRTTASACS